jgi:CheY-like chemotaxis protein
MQQVLMNLGANAGQALGDRPGHITFLLDVRQVADGDARGLAPGPYVELCVSDDGPGMEEDVRRRIFEPFFTTKGPEQGWGLGLAVVHGLVVASGGSIDCASSPGAGARFTILLPVAPPAAASARAAESIAPSSTERAGAGGEVLVVDDEPDIARPLGLMLSRRGVRCTILQDPLEALALFAKDPHRFAVVLTDLSMPGMTGAKLRDELRKLDAGLPVLLQTGSPDVVARAEGFDGYLVKPYSADDLMTALRRWIG